MPKETTEITPEHRESLLQREEVRAILKKTAYKHWKNYELSKLGLNNAEIASLTGSAKSSVGRDIWGYKTGRLKDEY